MSQPKITPGVWFIGTLAHCTGGTMKAVIFHFRQSNNPLFMLRMHFIIFLFALAYFGVRVRDLFGG
jgi:hypothetical protein